MINKTCSINPEIFKEIGLKAISNRKLHWVFIERISNTFEDVLEIVQYSISIGVSFSGYPSERTEKFLNSHNIDLRRL